MIKTYFYQTPFGVLRWSIKQEQCLSVGWETNKKQWQTDEQLSGVWSKAMDAYFDQKKPLPLERLNPMLHSFSPWVQRVFQLVQNVEWGKTISYKYLAIHSGAPRAYQAVAQVLKRNPYTIWIPCHRVVSVNFPQSIGGYFGTMENLKKRLLVHEGVI